MEEEESVQETEMSKGKGKGFVQETERRMERKIRSLYRGETA